MLFSLSGLGLSLYALLPGKKKPLARKLILFLGGWAGIIFSLVSRTSLDLAGFVMLVLCGAFGAAIVHHLITVFIGPLIFGRIWCGWGCWSAMIFDLLPFGRGSERLAGQWRRFPAAVLAATIAVAATACYGFGYRGMATIGSQPHRSELYWIVAINLLYYATGISLAFALKDNRAFCKYVCPTSVLLRITSRFSRLKIAGSNDLCNSCEACTKLCPMGIGIPDYVTRGQRVLSTDCILCRTCISVCPLRALRFSFDLDVGGPGDLR